MENKYHKSWAEILVASKFALVGLFATGVHISMVWLLMMVVGQPPFVANLLAFATAFGFSYVGHYHWSFKAQSRQGNNLRRFFLVAVSALVLNNILLVYMLEKAYFSELVSTIVSVFIIPLYTFIGSRFWAFK